MNLHVEQIGFNISNSNNNLFYCTNDDMIVSIAQIIVC